MVTKDNANGNAYKPTRSKAVNFIARRTEIYGRNTLNESEKEFFRSVLIDSGYSRSERELLVG